ncbi:PaaI family thioesterase [Neobacillus pocheonensis]|uniref:PaaI family thioesterase n=1 Tax=Neobacillus pocheonensis TaxID=363869 RepID=A0ABT0WGW1_9BACI|nr:PaaI family thioesterase [Neobacillus pocheonensis]
MSIADIKRLLQEKSSFDQNIGIQIKQLEVEDVILELPITPFLLNYNKILHGGVYAVLLDAVIGLTIRSQTENSLVTVNLNISYLAPVQEGEKIVATGKILNRGNSLVTGEGEVRDSSGNILAKAIGTFKMIRHR